MTRAYKCHAAPRGGKLLRRILGSTISTTDDAETTLNHARLLRDKPLLRRFYRQSYQFFLEARRNAPVGACLEIGSGGGFFKEILPEVITSDVLKLAGNDLATDAEALPFADGSLSAIFLLNALHHVPDVASYFDEACRCLAPRGVMAMVEPANTPFSRFVYRRLHHEPFMPDSERWDFARGTPLSAANGALPWIVFCRDREEFDRRFPDLAVRRVECCSPLSYLLSGGFTLPSLVPGFCAPAIDHIETLLCPANAELGLFMRVLIVRR